MTNQLGNIATKRHALTTAGMVTGIVAVVLFLLPIVTGNMDGALRVGFIFAFLLMPVAVVLMVIGWMIRLRKAAEHR